MTSSVDPPNMEIVFVFASITPPLLFVNVVPVVASVKLIALEDADLIVPLLVIVKPEAALPLIGFDLPPVVSTVEPASIITVPLACPLMLIILFSEFLNVDELDIVIVVSAEVKVCLAVVTPPSSISIE